MYQNYAALINGKHTYRDYGLYVTNTNPIAPPEVKVEYITIPGRNGSIDLTEALTGYTVYGNRVITLELGGKRPSNQWPGFMSDFLNAVHGKMVEVVFDNEPDWYYKGRATVESDYQKGNEIATFTLTINADPYKYSILTSVQPWLWDPFSFVDGVIRYYNQITVNGTTEVTVIGSKKPTIPVFNASAAMTVNFDGKTYDLTAGENKIYDIVLMDQEYTLKFTGTGTVSINYQAGRL